MSFTGPGTATLGAVASTAASVQLFAASTNVFGRTIYNSSTSVLYVAFATVASTASYSVQVGTNATYAFPVPTYSGPVFGIWSSANGTAFTTQW